MATFHFELVSPESQLFAGEVDSVIVPGTEGQFQVFAGHEPMMTALIPGVVSIVTGATSERLFVRGGFADVNATGFTILAEHAVALSSVKADEVSRDLQAAREDLADAKTDAAREAAASKIAGLEALMRALSN